MQFKSIDATELNLETAAFIKFSYFSPAALHQYWLQSASSFHYIELLSPVIWKVMRQLLNEAVDKTRAEAIKNYMAKCES